MKKILQNEKNNIRKYQKQLYSNTLENLTAMDKFLGTCNLSGLKEEDTENLKQINNNETEQ